MSNFIPMVYAVLKDKGIDTKGMSTDEAVEKYKEITGKDGGYDTKSGEKKVKDDHEELNKRARIYAEERNATIRYGGDAEKPTAKSQKFAELNNKISSAFAKENGYSFDEKTMTMTKEADGKKIKISTHTQGRDKNNQIKGGIAYTVDVWTKDGKFVDTLTANTLSDADAKAKKVKI